MPKSKSKSSSTPAPPKPDILTTPASPPPLSPPSSSSSSSSATKRLLREISDYNAQPNPSVLLHLGPTSDTNLLHWEAVLKGPPPSSTFSPYTGGLWLLSLNIPDNYPLQPPTIKFQTPICHPNINFATGEICLTLLTSEHWSPLYTLSSTMSAVQQLLLDPVSESPLNVDVANLYREGDLVGAEGLVRFWTREKRWSGEGEGGWISEVQKGMSGKLGD
jgi:peroxin-4